jgi:hypothetical protein
VRPLGEHRPVAAAVTSVGMLVLGVGACAAGFVAGRAF